MPANHNTMAKLTATATPMPGTATAARSAPMSSGTARRSCLPRALGGQRLRQRAQRQQEVDRRQPGGDQRGQRPLAPEHGKPRQLAADERPQDEAQPERDADDPHAARAVLGRGDVGDVGLRHGDVRGRDAAEHAGGDQQRQRRRRAQQRHADRRGGDAPQQHRAPPDPIRQPPPDRDEQELHDRIHGAGHRRDEVARAQPPRHPGQERDHQPEPEQVDEHGQEQRPDRCRSRG